MCLTDCSQKARYPFTGEAWDDMTQHLVFVLKSAGEQQQHCALAAEPKLPALSSLHTLSADKGQAKVQKWNRELNITTTTTTTKTCLMPHDHQCSSAACLAGWVYVCIFTYENGLYVVCLDVTQSFVQLCAVVCLIFLRYIASLQLWGLSSSLGDKYFVFLLTIENNICFGEFLFQALHL